MRRIGIIYDTLQKSKGSHGTHLMFTGLPDVEVIIADPNPNPPDSIRIGAVLHYLSWQEMLEKETLDAVVVCSRLPVDHYVPLKAALERGLHVFCEKPVSSELSEIDELCSLAEKNHCLAGVAHLARYSKVFCTIKRCIDAGMIGTPLTFYGRGKEDERGGGEDLLVLGTHILDIGCMLFGMPESLFAEVYQSGRPLRHGDLLPVSEPIGLVAGDNIFAHFHFPNMVDGIFQSRRGLYSGKQVRMGVTVVGTDGMLSMRYDNDRFVRLSHSPYPPEDAAVYEVIPFNDVPKISGAKLLNYQDFAFWYFAEANREAGRNFLAAMDGKEPLACTFADARNVLELINGIYFSALENRKIILPLTNRINPLR